MWIDDNECDDDDDGEEECDDHDHVCTCSIFPLYLYHRSKSLTTHN